LNYIYLEYLGSCWKL